MTPCPHCNGAHLYSLTYQHKVSCPLYAADSVTANLDNITQQGTRVARNHEKELIDEQHHEKPSAGEQYGIRFHHRGVHDRRIVILDDHGCYLRDCQPAGATPRHP